AGENAVSGPMVDFEKAATKAAPAVVHIRTLKKSKQVSGSPQLQDNPFKDFFGDDLGDMFGGRGGSRLSPEQRASGSGVAISADGYIVTNNHVVDEADELLVTLNNKKDYKAKVIGKDPASDLAVIKIEANNLPYLTFANSDDVHLGQWVLAIGYPLNLETTVTSGIISAKSRSLGINRRQSSSPVESFIQTDAAVNPGNSGGALVNTDGNVIGINSAIASPTGSYAGYAYAIPSNMVQKVVSDIIKYGSTKRAYLGVMFGSDQMSEEDRKKNNVKEGEGVFVMDVAKGSAAEEAGVQKGDFITKVNGTEVSTGTEMIEKIAALRPGDKINITFQRNGTEKTATATLKGNSGTYASVKQQVVEQLGATFEDLDKNKAAQLQLPSGVVVKQLGQGILTDQTRIKEGFIITKVNNTKVSTVEELKQAIKSAGNSAVISGVYPNQPQTEYQYALNDLQ
ncbi:MAG TPA: Do family serine endopeptidase, partial [Segetibacter sp.]|nr:Do family serine endopeptidase [Segetibacter sp.]